MHVRCCGDGYAKSPPVGHDGVRGLHEEERRLAVRVVAHLARVLGVVAADAVDAVDGKPPARALHGQGGGRLDRDHILHAAPPGIGRPRARPGFLFIYHIPGRSGTALTPWPGPVTQAALEEQPRPRESRGRRQGDPRGQDGEREPAGDQHGGRDARRGPVDGDAGDRGEGPQPDRERPGRPSPTLAALRETPRSPAGPGRRSSS